MYLSRIPLNVRADEVRRAIESPQVMHAAIEKAVCAGGERLLWRMDSLNGQLYLLLQSGGIPKDAPFGAQWQTRHYAPFLAQIAKGQRWRFRLTANPIHSVKTEGKQRGKITACITTGQQIDWLTRKAESCGFIVLQPFGESSVIVGERENKKFNRQGQFVTLTVASFEGMLEVSDEKLLVEAMKNGIGRAKAYGCGLLTLVGP